MVGKLNNYGFMLTPCHIPFCAKKDQAKADIATKYIGFGIKGTSTYRYGDDARSQNIPVNVIIDYTYKDVVYVSINGGNNFRQDNFDNTIQLAINALLAGATIVCDNDNQRNKPYNSVGEGRFYKELCQYFGDSLEELTNPLFSTFKLNSASIENFTETLQAKLRNKLSPFWALSEQLLVSNQAISMDKLFELATICEDNKKDILELLNQTENK